MNLPVRKVRLLDSRAMYLSRKIGSINEYMMNELLYDRIMEAGIDLSQIETIERTKST